MIAEAPSPSPAPSTLDDTVTKWTAPTEPPPPPRRRRKRWIAAASAPLCLLALWIAVHRVPWLGPLLADGLRAVVGPDAVAKLEDVAYALQDRFNRAFRAKEPPKAYWTVPPKKAAARPTATPAAGCAVPTFEPADVGPVHSSWSAPGDGQWTAIEDRRRPNAPAAMYKTLLHPDKLRSWSAVSVVAVDLRRVRLHLVAGYHEPKGGTREAFGYERPAIIPRAHHGALIAAFNGGFKTVHGHWGMKVDGVTILNPRQGACWVARTRDDTLLIGAWDRLAAREPDTTWWRQTPACMVDEGTLHPGLVSEKNTYWGATLDGDTVIRRSAIGLSRDGLTLYSGIGDHTTARSMAQAMKHAGAWGVAQLDVNWSYPKFVVYQPRPDGELHAEKLCDGFELTEDEYIRTRSYRDFFYLTLASDATAQKAVCGG